MDVNFVKRPSAESIRTVLHRKIAGEIEVQEISNSQEVLISTGAKDDKSLQIVRNDMIAALASTYNPSAGNKLDVNNVGQAALADRLREPLTRAGVALSEDQLQAVAKAITGYRDAHSGIIRSLDDLSGVSGVTPQILNVLKQETFPGVFAIRSFEFVGPKIGADLRQQAINVVLIALGAMLIYIAFRFEWIYGVAAVIAVFHDTLITIGLFSLLDKQIDLTVIAALLTLVGYSMNDTIVTFDRIRENLKLGVRGSFTEIVNMSINQTLSRTVLTSGLTFLTALSLLLFGGQVLKGFSLALVIGIMIGTYSSVFIASPILIYLHNLVVGRSRGARAVAPARAASQPKSVKAAKTAKN
jgi:preprotein translocase subunit SecF